MNRRSRPVGSASETMNTAYGEFKCEADGVSVVALGDFNPPVFHPLWLANHNLIRTQEADSASIQIVHKEALIFSTDWFELRVTDENFTLASLDVTKLLPLKDLVQGIFRLLEHTPIRGLGLNSHSHYGTPSVGVWHKFGHFLAPKDGWIGVLADPGTLSLTMQGSRPESKAQYVRVRVEPSTKISEGLYFDVNQHYDIVPGSALQDNGANQLLRLIEAEWEPFNIYRREVPVHLIRAYRQSEAHAFG